MLRDGSVTVHCHTDVLNASALGLGIAVGHRTGLFDAMASLAAPATHDEIAAAAKLHPRYVREWLCIMVTGDVVHTTGGADGGEAHAGAAAGAMPGAGAGTGAGAGASAPCAPGPAGEDPIDAGVKFVLPPAFHDTLCSGDGNMARYCEEIPMLCQNLKALCTCFAAGGGVPYAAFTDFDRWMMEGSDTSQTNSLVSKQVPAMHLTDVFAEGAVVADVGCGLGTAVLLLAAAFPRSHFVGLDIAADAVEKARTRAKDRGIGNATFAVVDASQLGSPDAAAAVRAAVPPGRLPPGRGRGGGVFDVVTAFDSVHDAANPQHVIDGVAAALKPGGTFAMVEVTAASSVQANKAHGMAPFLYAVSMAYCMTVSLAQDGGVGAGMMWGRERATAALQRAGFTDVNEVQVDGFNSAFLCTK